MSTTPSDHGHDIVPLPRWEIARERIGDFFRRRPPQVARRLIAHDPTGARCVDYDAMDVSQVPPFVLEQFERWQHDRVVVTKGPSQKRLAVVVPYRHREDHLRALVPHLNGYLNDEGITANIFVVHQADEGFFCKGRLLNIGYVLTKDTHDYFCFHDVDHLPIEASYQYVDHPLALANATVDHHPGYFGGVAILTKPDFEHVNGYSNEYWHWGWDDEDIRNRCLIQGLTPITYPAARFDRLPHPPSVTQTPDGEYHEDRKTLRYLYGVEQRMIKRYKDFSAGKSKVQDSGLNTLRFSHVGTEDLDGYTRFDVVL